MTGQPSSSSVTVALTTSSSCCGSSGGRDHPSGEARFAVLQQCKSNSLQEKQQEDSDGCEGTVDHLKSLLDQETTRYAPCLDYLEAIATAAPLPPYPSSSSTSSLSSRASSPVSSLGTDSLVGQAEDATPPAAPDRVNEAWRRKLCEWSFEVVDHFGMEREVVSVAMNYLDRMVAKFVARQQKQQRMEQEGKVNEDDVDALDEPLPRHLAKRQFQLVAVASLYIAVKLHGEAEELDMDRRSLNVDVFVELSRGFFQAEAIEAMERNILFNLEWHLNPPTPLKFIASLMRLIPNWSAPGYYSDCDRYYGCDGDDVEEPQHHRFNLIFKAIFDIAMYLTELSVCVSTFTFHSKNSIVAYASILCAMEALEDTLPLPYDARVKFVNRTAEATGMYPESEEVRCVRNLLCELCPSIRERDVASLIMMDDGEEGDGDDDAGKSSPICVSRVVPEDDEQDDAIHKHSRFFA